MTQQISRAAPAARRNRRILFSSRYKEHLPMKRFTFLASTLVIALAAVSGVTTYVDAAEDGDDGDKAVIEGQVVDMKCWLAMQMPGGGKHLKCAVKCAEMGIPAGVVEKNTGQTFTLLAPAVGFGQYMGKTVRVTGPLAAKSTAIIPEKLEVMEGDEWVEVELPESMM